MPDLRSSVGSALERGGRCLADAGIPDAAREALRLWSDLADCPPARVLLARHVEPAPALRAAFERAVARRAAGEPLAHVTGLAGFRRLTLASDGRALIPRPETEGMVDLALAMTRRGRALDLGTGSGCLALALADEGDYDPVVAVDRSAAALDLAAANAARTGRRVRWVRGDWTAPVRAERFALVVSNPPYLTSEEVARLDPSVARWEPADALDGGPDGLEAIRQVLTRSLGVLLPGGAMVLELDSRRAGPTARLATDLGWQEVRITQDTFGRDRYLTARRELTA